MWLNHICGKIASKYIDDSTSKSLPNLFSKYTTKCESMQVSDCFEVIAPCHLKSVTNARLFHACESPCHTLSHIRCKNNHGYQQQTSVQLIKRHRWQYNWHSKLHEATIVNICYRSYYLGSYFNLKVTNKPRLLFQLEMSPRLLHLSRLKMSWHFVNMELFVLAIFYFQKWKPKIFLIVLFNKPTEHYGTLNCRELY